MGETFWIVMLGGLFGVALGKLLDSVPIPTWALWLGLTVIAMIALGGLSL